MAATAKTVSRLIDIPPVLAADPNIALLGGRGRGDSARWRRMISYGRILHAGEGHLKVAAWFAGARQEDRPDRCGVAAADLEVWKLCTKA